MASIDPYKRSYFINMVWLLL